MRIAKVSALIVPVAGIALQVSLLVVLGLGGYRVASGAITVANLVTFVMFLFLLIAPLGSFFGAITSVNQALGALGRIQEVLDLPPETAEDDEIAATLRQRTTRCRLGRATGEAPAIEFRDVRFRYPEAVVATRRKAETEALAVLENAHVDSVRRRPARRDRLEAAELAPPREATCSGASRSPCRAARASRSSARRAPARARRSRSSSASTTRPRARSSLGGEDVRTLDRDDLRAQLGYVEQDAPTLAGTIADNLRLASPEASDDDCERVLRAVNLGEVLERNPLGIDAPVGESGVMLSGGERQRLAIARALLAAPPILLLDESTSSLDGLNEQRMRDAIDAVASGRTLIVIAHRLSTVVDSDHIVVMDHGQVVGQGTHSELVESTPLYRDLARHQLLV